LDLGFDFPAGIVGLRELGSPNAQLGRSHRVEIIASKSSGGIRILAEQSAWIGFETVAIPL